MIFSMMIAKGESAKLSTELFVVWVIMGILIYTSYGYKKNRLAEKTLSHTGEKLTEENEKITNNI